MEADSSGLISERFSRLSPNLGTKTFSHWYHLRKLSLLIFMHVSACKMNVHKRCHRNVANNCGINAKEMAQRLKDMGLTGNILSESMRVKKVGCVDFFA